METMILKETHEGLLKLFFNTTLFLKNVYSFFRISEFENFSLLTTVQDLQR